MISSFLKYFSVTFLVFITPIQGLFILITAFVAFDTIFAVYMNVTKRGWRSFSSTKLFNIVVKTFFYMGTILLAYLIDTHIFDGSLFSIKNLFSKVVTFVWMYIEIKSIDETSMKLGNKSFWVILKEVIGKTKDLKKDINDFKEE
jgi:hypothetical protein